MQSYVTPLFTKILLVISSKTAQTTEGYIQSGFITLCTNHPLLAVALEVQDNDLLMSNWLNCSH